MTRKNAASEVGLPFRVAAAAKIAAVVFLSLSFPRVRVVGRVNKREPLTLTKIATKAGTKTGVGARLRRKEDDRFLHGRGQYIGDLRFPRMREVAFVRSPVAHARLIGVRIPEHLRACVFTADDLAEVRPIRAVSPLPGFQASEQPPLAMGKLRHVGELIAMCVADTRAQAEDIAAEVLAEYEELPAVVDMLDAQKPDSVLVHDQVKRNVYLEVGFDGPVEQVAKTAPVKVTRELRTARQVMSPIECRGFVAQWDTRLSQLILHGATQFPHVVRTGLSQVLGLPEIQIRVVSPDVGGGFGYKAILAAEEVCLCWLAMRCGHPVRWLEDRREQLTANANCREHHYAISAYTDEAGRILAFEAKAAVDSGAYSAYPFTSAIEPSQVSAILPGPYDIPVYRCKAAAVVTNKCPQLPYRGVARPNVCYAMELMIDAIARQIGKEPYEVRLANLVRPEQMPYDNVTDKHFDSGDYPQLLRMAGRGDRLSGGRARQKRGEPDGRLIGTRHCGVLRADRAWHHRRRQAARALRAGLRADHAGRAARGQGRHSEHRPGARNDAGADRQRMSRHRSGRRARQARRYRAVALFEWCLGIARHRLGGWGDRARLQGTGGRVAKIGAAMLQTDVASVTVRDGGVFGPHGSVSLADIARAFYLAPADLPGDIDPHGLEVTAGYAPTRLTGVHTGSVHATVVAVDPETGGVEILDYVVVEDAGVLSTR